MVSVTGLSRTIPFTLVKPGPITISLLISISNIISKFNSATKVILTGTITNPSNSQFVDALWETNANNVDLYSVSLTPLQARVSPNNSIVFQLALQPLSLTNGLSYKFILSGQLSGSANRGIASAEISILINTPPYGGNLLSLIHSYITVLIFEGLVYVNPTFGYEIDTIFNFFTQSWISSSDNYPLKYLFSYYDNIPTGQKTVSPYSSVPYVSSRLSQGLFSTNYTIYCIAYCSDVYNSSSSVQSSVQVFEIKDKSSKLALISDLLQNSDPSTGSQIVAAASNSFSMVDCSSAPSCTSLNRDSCRSVANTCGQCLNGFIGVSGESNAPCNTANVLKRNGYACISNSQCISSNCTNICVDRVKQCPNSCLQQGSCQFFSYYSLQSIGQCLESDTSCYAACVCYGQFRGRDCSYSAAASAIAMQVSSALADAIERNIHFQDITPNVISNLAVSVSQILYDLNLVNFNAFEKCTSALLFVVNKYPLLATDPSTIGNVINAFNSIVLNGASIPNSLLANITLALNTLAASSQTSLAVGEVPTTYSTMTMNILVAKNSLSSTQNQLSVPQSSYLIFNKVPPTTVSLSNPNTGVLTRRLLSTESTTTTLGFFILILTY